MPSLRHIAWSSIALLHNVIRTLNFHKERDGKPLPTVVYRGKVKLHGTNCAVQIHANEIVTQSREAILTPEADLKGFSKWAHLHEASFSRLPAGFTVFGEWAGPGIEKGMAVSALPGKVFAVFALQVGVGEGAVVIYDPSEIASYVRPLGIPGVYVLPWEGEPFTIDYADPASVQVAVEHLNQVVVAVEREDPWVKATFGVAGLGEGVVLYPMVPARTSPEALALLMFKAKGDKHRTAGTKQAVQVSPEVAGSATEFVTLMVTEARLQQGVSTACGGECTMRNIGAFLRWVAEDTKKESVAELEASGLTWDQVQKQVQDRARDWFRARAS